MRIGQLSVESQKNLFEEYFFFFFLVKGGWVVLAAKDTADEQCDYIIHVLPYLVGTLVNQIVA